MKNRTPSSNLLIWAIYLALLAVLLPHTAWAFGRFEPTAIPLIGEGAAASAGATVIAWTAAAVFELSIAIFTHKLAGRIERTPRYSAGTNPHWLRRWLRVRLRTFAYRYLNPYAAALLLSVSISTLANLAHAIEYAQPFAITQALPIRPIALAAAFGGILPLVSLVFARALANVAQTESQQDERLARVRSDLKQARADLSQAERALDQAEQEANHARTQLNQAEHLTLRLFGESKQDRIIAAAELWPDLARKPTVIAIIARASPAYTVEVLQKNGPSQKKPLPT